MYIYKKKSKKGTVYYLCKSYRDASTGKSRTKIVEKLGTEEEIRKKHGESIKLDEWLDQKKQDRIDNYNHNFKTHKKLSRKKIRSLNIGYLALQKICYQLKIDKIINTVKQKSGFKGDLVEIFLSLIYDRIILAEHETSYFNFIKLAIENFDFSYEEIASAIKIFSEYSSYIQNKVYLNANKYFKYDCSVIFNDCVRYCYNMSDDKGSFIKVATLELFFDKNGLPLAFVNKETDSKNKKLITKSLNSLNDTSTIITYSDSLPSSLIDECEITQYNIRTVNIKILKKYLKDWILHKNGWSACWSDQIFNLKDIEKIMLDGSIPKEKQGKFQNVIFYKQAKLKEDKSKQLVVGFNYLSKIEDESIRNNRYERLKDAIDSSIIKQYQTNPKEFDNFFENFKKFLDANIDDKTKQENFMYEFNKELIEKDSLYDGYFACICDIETKNIENILVNWYTSWMTDYIFSNMKKEFKFIAKKSNADDNINAHLLLSFVSLVVTKIFQKLLKARFNSVHVQAAMTDQRVINIPNIGWIPTFIPTDITDALDEIIGCSTDLEFITDEQMSQIIRKSKTSNKHIE